MPWVGWRLTREAHEAGVDRLAGCIRDPVLRLRFLRATAPRAPVSQPLSKLHLRHWILGAGIVVLLLTPFLIKLAAGKPEAPHMAPIALRRAVAGDPPKTVTVWQVEQTGDAEFYSNGLRVDTSLTVANRPRLYTAFQRNAASINRVRST